jgi:hypothetical protein
VHIRDPSAASGERLAAVGRRLVHDAQRSGLGCVVAALPLVVAAIASVTQSVLMPTTASATEQAWVVVGVSAVWTRLILSHAATSFL